MKNIVQLLVFAIAIAAYPAKAQNTNPYAIFGHKPAKVAANDNTGQVFSIKNLDPASEVKELLFDYGKDIVSFIGENDKVLDEIELKQNVNLRFLSVDPHQAGYAGLSPYSFVANRPISAIDPDGRDVYILFYTVGNGRGDELFQAAAMTRKANIESSPGFNPATDKVAMIRVSNMADIKQQVQNVVDAHSPQYGKTTEAGFWSHNGQFDGPIAAENTRTEPGDPFYNANKDQLSLRDWAKIDFNWKEEGAYCGFYGCRSGQEDGNSSFARNTSALGNFENVTVGGQQDYSYPSDNLDTRNTSPAKGLLDQGYGIGPTYMVGGIRSDNNVIRKTVLAMTIGIGPSYLFIKAKPMNFFRSGKKVGVGKQSKTKASPMF